MHMELVALLAAATFATLVALLVARAGDSSRTWVRRVFLLLLNVTPGGVGVWRRQFSRREAVLSAWFLAFIVALTSLAVFAIRR
jgi:hypothetical protein